MLFIKTLQITLALFTNWALSPDIYSYSVNDLAHKTTINFKDFKGKKILIVNSGLSSRYTNQLRSLDSLAQQYADKLVVVVFPSNSFGNESEAEKDINRIIDQRYKVHFYMAEKVPVAGKDIHPVYQWLTQKNLNGVMDTQIKTDFMKFLINEEGNLVGVFSAGTLPVSSTMEEAINTNFKN